MIGRASFVKCAVYSLQGAGSCNVYSALMCDSRQIGNSNSSEDKVVDVNVSKSNRKKVKVITYNHSPGNVMVV